MSQPIKTTLVPQPSEETEDYKMDDLNTMTTDATNHITHRNQGGTSDGDLGEVTDEADILMSSDEREENKSEAETLALEDEVTDEPGEENTNNKKTKKVKRRSKTKETVDDDALLLSDKPVKKFKRTTHPGDEDGKIASTSMATTVIKSDEDGWSKDFELEEAKGRWETRGVIILVVIVTALLVALVVYIFAGQTKGDSNIDFRFGNYFSNQMVLQGSPQQSVIWGYGPKATQGRRVLVTVAKMLKVDLASLKINETNNEKKEKKIKEEDIYEEGEVVSEAEASFNSFGSGHTWKAFLGPIKEKGPFIVSASLIGHNEENVIRLYDVVLGDVWLCTGYHKIENPVTKTLNHSWVLNDELIKKLRNEKNQEMEDEDLRIFSVLQAKSDPPWFDVHVVDINWMKADFNTMKRLPLNSLSRFPGLCWYFGLKLRKHLKKPIGLVAATYGESSLADWAPPSVADNCFLDETESSSRIWNGMILPLLEMPVKGQIWQQGPMRSGVSQSNYSCLLREFIEKWRSSSCRRVTQPSSHTHSLYFGIIQAFPNNSSKDPPKNTELLRWLATGGYGYLPNESMKQTFLTPTMDLPNPEEPLHLIQAAERTFRSALQAAYHVKSPSPPIPIKFKVESVNKVKIVFDEEIEIKNQNGFEICCSQMVNQTCFWEQALIQEDTTNSLFLTGFSCTKQFFGFRYAWSDMPCPFLLCSIYSRGSSLPLASYLKLGLIFKPGPDFQNIKKKTHLSDRFGLK